MPKLNNTYPSTPYAGEKVQHLELNSIEESHNNPRKTFSAAAAAEMLESVRTQGVLQPIVVRPILGLPEGDEAFEVVFGHLRLRAALAAGHATIPAIVRAMSNSDADLARLHENLEREDVHYIEEAEAMARLIGKKVKAAAGGQEQKDEASASAGQGAREVAA